MTPRRDRAGVVARAILQAVARRIADNEALYDHIANMLADEFDDVRRQTTNDLLDGRLIPNNQTE
jgi:hypothetical protein